MAVTPQTNIDLPGMARHMAGIGSFAICGHVSPDGDCLGSQLVVWHALTQLGKEAVCILAEAGTVKRGLAFLPGVEGMVPARDLTGAFEAFVMCDVPTVERIGTGAAALRARCPVTFTLDHHAHSERVSEYTYVDPEAASTTMLAWELARHLGVQRTPEMAVCAYTGLVSDTGRFQFQNTDAEALRAAHEMAVAGASPFEVAQNVFQSRSRASLALEAAAVGRMRFLAGGTVVISHLTRADFEQAHAVKSDAEPLINTLRSLEGIRVACMVRQEEGAVRGSLRAKDATDVADVARRLGGGGHRAAAGFSLALPLDEALCRVEAALCEAVGKRAATGAAGGAGR